MCLWHSLAEVKEQALKDEHRSGAAQDSERLTRKQTEHSTSQRRPDKTLQHPLHRQTKTHTSSGKHSEGSAFEGMSVGKHYNSSSYQIPARMWRQLLLQKHFSASQSNLKVLIQTNACFQHKALEFCYVSICCICSYDELVRFEQTY